MTDTTVATSATTPDASRVAPNLFTFTGRRDGIQIVFSETGLDGRAQFSYTTSTRDVSATGSPDRRRARPARQARHDHRGVRADLHTITVTLVLPDLGGLSRPITPFRTFVVLTTNRTSIGGPGLVTGPIRSTGWSRGTARQQEVLF